MKCAWNELLAILPQNLKHEADRHRDTLQELRLRLDKPPELVTAGGSVWLTGAVAEPELRFVVNTASRYSPWAAETAAKGYITAPGGHRIGLCGEAVTQGGQARGMRNVTSLNIRVARDFPGIADKAPSQGNVLILGPPGSGKTTLLRDLIRNIAKDQTVAVVDERGELFPAGFDRGLRTDVLTGCGKAAGIDMLLRTMGPGYIAVDEITAAEDCRALRSALWCGVGLLATAHAASREDLLRRPVYRPLVESGCFDTLLILRRDKSWVTERMDASCSNGWARR